MTPAPEALRVSGLDVRYGDREILRGLNLGVAQGEIYGLLGPNGVGKTTLIRTICGRIRPVAGRVTIGGGAIGRDVLGRIGLVPQDLALYTHLTARENLEVFGRLSGLSRRDTAHAITWASAACQLSSRLDERVELLSGGWKRRLNIAASILHRPVLLILDEPTVGVDVEARGALHDVIRALSATGMGVLLTTHDLEQAETLCTKVGFLRNGAVDPEGPSRVLVAQAFGTEKEVILELRHALDEQQSGLLRGAGFAPISDGKTWTMRSDVPDDATVKLSAALLRAGIEARELRVREPGLDSLFVLLNRAQGPAS